MSTFGMSDDKTIIFLKAKNYFLYPPSDWAKLSFFVDAALQRLSIDGQGTIWLFRKILISKQIKSASEPQLYVPTNEEPKVKLIPPDNFWVPWMKAKSP